MSPTTPPTPAPTPLPAPTPAPAPRSAGAPAPGGPAAFVVASFNVHAGVDGWGRPYDVVAACREIDADVLVMEECWATAAPNTAAPDTAAPDTAAPDTAAPNTAAPDTAAPDTAAPDTAAPDTAAPDTPGTAAAVGDALGYSVLEVPLSGGRRAHPHPHADDRWMRAYDWRGSSHAIYLDEHLPMRAAVARSLRFRQAEPGHWGIAVLSRLPVLDHRVLDLGRLRRDRARRAALVVRVDVGGRTLAVVGTHMTHISYGSPLHFFRLRHLLGRAVGEGPAVLVGDMNLWGPPVAAFLPGWRRVVRGKTWPAWNPHSQVDHILTRGAVEVLGGEVLATAGSDHRPVRARLTLR